MDVSWCYTRVIAATFSSSSIFGYGWSTWLPEHFHYALLNCLYNMIILRLILINIPAIVLSMVSLLTRPVSVYQIGVGHQRSGQ
jgi:multisubunit Na+/H+ antiporter MnhG subunit